MDFCIQRTYKSVYVIPPVTECLAKDLRPCSVKYIYDYLKKVGRDVIRLFIRKIVNGQRLLF